jgi:hypothetical protein
LGGATRGETVLHVFIWEIYLKTEIYMKVLGIQVCKNHGPQGSGEAIIGETVLHVFI